MQRKCVRHLNHPIRWEVSMNSLLEIESAIERLTPEDLSRFKKWFTARAYVRAGYSSDTDRVEEPAAAYCMESEPHRLSVEDYLQLEMISPIRHEYVAGEIFAMSGASLRHNRISSNLLNVFSSHLRGGPCQAFF